MWILFTRCKTLETHSFATLTPSFLKFCDSWIKIRTAHFLWSYPFTQLVEIEVHIPMHSMFMSCWWRCKTSFNSLPVSKGRRKMASLMQTCKAVIGRTWEIKWQGGGYCRKHFECTYFIAQRHLEVNTGFQKYCCCTGHVHVFPAVHGYCSQKHWLAVAILFKICDRIRFSMLL